MKELTSQKQLSKIVLKGYKSIKECSIDLGSLNVLIGCNGAGKSNFISFFRMIQQILEKNLQIYVGKQGGPDSLLHFGRKVTEKLSAELYFGNNGYKFVLEPTVDNRMMFVNEQFWWKLSGDWDISSGHFETKVDSQKNKTGIFDYTVPAMRSWRVYHFHDTGENSPLIAAHGINDNLFLRPNGQNLAAFLYLLKNKYEGHYDRIVKTVRLAAPYFGDFNLRFMPHNEDMIELEWFERGQDIPFKASHLSDGTLRFICLATVLLQPEKLQPETILVDEPELGLHPYAIKLLASLFRSTAFKKQIIVSTQSVELLNEFDPEDVVVVDRADSKSTLRRLTDKELEGWIDDYTLGELWQKNIIGGRPAR